MALFKNTFIKYIYLYVIVFSDSILKFKNHNSIAFRYSQGLDNG